MQKYKAEDFDGGANNEYEKLSKTVSTGETVYIKITNGKETIRKGIGYQFKKQKLTGWFRTKTVNHKETHETFLQIVPVSGKMYKRA